jgi:hypothetical protein
MDYILKNKMLIFMLCRFKTYQIPTETINAITNSSRVALAGRVPKSVFIRHHLGQDMKALEVFY